jgi:hypothetical protein
MSAAAESVISSAQLEDPAMKGVHFVTDSDGKAIAVQIDIEQWGELWEDMYDRMLIEQRKSDDTVPWKDVKKELQALGKLNES